MERQGKEGKGGTGRIGEKRKGRGRKGMRRKLKGEGSGGPSISHLWLYDTA